jgi:cytochrome b6
MMASFREWLRERAPVADVAAIVRHKRVPHHRYSVWYYFGGITLFLFGIQLGTGALLLLYYRPSAAEAYESVQFVMTRVPFGWLVRSIHAWAANILIGAVFAHLFSVLFLKAYRRPRELTWMSGVLLLFLTLAFGFTGYLLPWNELSFFATRVGTDMAAALPVVGEFTVRFLRGGPDVTGATLTRFFAMHVAILPAIGTAIVAAHLVLVQRHGMSVPPSIEDQTRARGRVVPSVPFYPHYVLHDLFAWTLALALLAALAAFFPWELGRKADVFASAPAGIRPEWYFLWTFQALKYMPSHVLGMNGELLVVAGLGLGATVLLVLPLLERGTPSSRRLVTWAGLAAIGFMGAMTVLALRSSAGQ